MVAAPLEPVVSFGQTQLAAPREHKTLPFKAIPDAPPPAQVELEPHPALGATTPSDGLVGPADEPEDGGAELHHYARFCAERSAYPDHAGDVRRRYRLADEQAEQQLKDYWSARFAQEPELRGRWISLSEHYRSQLGRP
jgi:hypothetical protein